MLSSEEIKQICELQHKIVVCRVLINKMPMAYTNDNVHQLEKDIQIRAKHDEYSEKMMELISKFGSEVVGDTFSNKELLQKPENKFTFEDQRKATKEVIGKELTLEEFLEMYGDK